MALNQPQVCKMHVFPKSNHSFTLTCTVYTQYFNAIGHAMNTVSVIS